MEKRHPPSYICRACGNTIGISGECLTVEQIHVEGQKNVIAFDYNYCCVGILRKPCHGIFYELPLHAFARNNVEKASPDKGR